MNRTFISYGRWYYDHASTWLPTLTDSEGKWATIGDIERVCGEGWTCLVRPATRAEHEEMLRKFDITTDQMEKAGFVYGIGNFDPKNPPNGVAEAAKQIKARARVEAFR